MNDALTVVGEDIASNRQVFHTRTIRETKTGIGVTHILLFTRCKATVPNRDTLQFLQARNHHGFYVLE